MDYECKKVSTCARVALERPRRTKLQEKLRRTEGYSCSPVRRRVAAPRFFRAEGVAVPGVYSPNRGHGGDLLAGDGAGVRNPAHHAHRGGKRGRPRAPEERKSRPPRVRWVIPRVIIRLAPPAAHRARGPADGDQWRVPASGLRFAHPQGVPRVVK